MSLTGACPGTLIPQSTTGVASGPYVLFGGLLGGVLYSRYGKLLLGRVQNKTLIEKPTVFQSLGINQGNATAVYEAICLGMIGVLAHYFPDRRGVLVPSVIGGLCIGLSQVASLVLTGGSLGISAAYEQAGDLFWWAEQSVFEGKKIPRPSIRATSFVLGTALGSWGMFKYLDIPPPPSLSEITATRAVLGGILLTFGSRIAGGCTSGHGISGMSQLSISSFITVASMFGGGVFLTRLIG